MIARVIASFSIGALLGVVAVPAKAADKVIGTFTVEGKTVTFADVYATLERDSAQAGHQYLMLLVADVPVAPADRAPSRLLTLAKAGT